MQRPGNNSSTQQSQQQSGSQQSDNQVVERKNTPPEAPEVQQRTPWFDEWTDEGLAVNSIGVGIACFVIGRMFGVDIKPLLMAIALLLTVNIYLHRDRGGIFGSRHPLFSNNPQQPHQPIGEIKHAPTQRMVMVSLSTLSDALRQEGGLENLQLRVQRFKQVAIISNLINGNYDNDLKEADQILRDLVQSSITDNYGGNINAFLNGEDLFTPFETLQERALHFVLDQQSREQQAEAENRGENQPHSPSFSGPGSRGAR